MKEEAAEEKNEILRWKKGTYASNSGTVDTTLATRAERLELVPGGFARELLVAAVHARGVSGRELE